MAGKSWDLFNAVIVVDVRDVCQVSVIAAACSCVTLMRVA